MNCRVLLLVALSVLLALVCAGSAHAIFPGDRPGSLGDGTTMIGLLHGWWSPTPVAPNAISTDAWYSCFATTDVRIAQTQRLILTLKLANTPIAASPIMYVVTNFNNNGPVFTSSPHPLAGGTYTGLWRVINVTWRIAKPHLITNAFPAGVTNPTGLPPVNQAVYTASIGGLPLTPVSGSFPPLRDVAKYTFMDCPIFAIGGISNPWSKPTSSVQPYVYRIPQGEYLSGKFLTIPFWNVYCRNFVTRAIFVSRVVMPDVSDASLASLIGANLAPRLALVPWVAPQPTVSGAKSTMYVINWDQRLTFNGPPAFVPFNQYPVLDACPTSLDWRNQNRAYSPVDAFVVLNRSTTLINTGVLFNNRELILAQLQAGRLTSAPPYIYPPLVTGPAVNAPAVCDGFFR